MTKHPLKDITFVHGTEKPHVFPSETSNFTLNINNVLMMYKGFFNLIGLSNLYRVIFACGIEMKVPIQ